MINKRIVEISLDVKPLNSNKLKSPGVDQELFFDVKPIDTIALFKLHCQGRRG